MVECADGLFNGSISIGPVGVDQVYIFELEALESGIDAFDDVFSGEANVIDGVVAVGCSPVDLCIVR